MGGYWIGATLLAISMLAAPAWSQSAAAPPEQKVFVKAIVEAKKKFRSGVNAELASDAYDERKAAICKLVGPGLVVNWIGTVASIAEVEGNRRSIEIAIWLDVSLGTALAPNAGPASSTLIDAGTPLFDDVSRLSPGDVVSFSGTLLRGLADNCVLERSASLRDSMMTPSFAIRFRSIQETDAGDGSVMSGTAERMKALRRDEATWALRGTDFDKYLTTIKRDNLPLWRDEARSLRPDQFRAYLNDLQVKEPRKFIDLGWRWEKDKGFGFATIVNFQITPRLSYPIKDVTVRCVGYGVGGSAIADYTETFYEIFAPRKSRTINDVDVGFRARQMARLACRVAGAKRL